MKKGVLIEALPCIIYIRERYWFSLVCTFENAIKKFGVNVDLEQKGALWFEKILTIGVVISSNLSYSSK